MAIVSITRVVGSAAQDAAWDEDAVAAAVRQAIELCGGEGVVPPGATVLLKPNLVKPARSGSGVVTDARLTAAVALWVLSRNPARVILGEGSSVGYDFPGQVDSLTAMEASGTADVARRYGLEMIDLNHDERVMVEAANAYVMGTFGVAKSAWEADVIIDLPVIKTHGRTGITCALKNMKGVLAGAEKKRTHRLGLDRAIVDLNRVMLPDLVVVDALMGLAGTHTRPEDRMPLGAVVAGCDAVAVDTVCATMMGFDPRQVLHVKLAGEAGLGEADMAQIVVRGTPLAEVTRPFQPYSEAFRERFGAVTLIEKDTCTGCMGELESTFLYLHKAGYDYRLEDLTLILGMPDELPPLEGTPVVVGQCPRAYRELGVYVPGCPPHGIKITEGVCEALGLDRAHVHAVIEALHAAGE